MVGFAALVLLIPLYDHVDREDVEEARLRTLEAHLHRLAYIATALAVVHFVWRVREGRDGARESTACVLALLFAIRIGAWMRSRATNRRAGG